MRGHPVEQSRINFERYAASLSEGGLSSKHRAGREDKKEGENGASEEGSNTGSRYFCEIMIFDSKYGFHLIIVKLLIIIIQHMRLRTQ